MGAGDRGKESGVVGVVGSTRLMPACGVAGTDRPILVRLTLDCEESLEWRSVPPSICAGNAGTNNDGEVLPVPNTRAHPPGVVHGRPSLPTEPATL